MPTRVLVPSGVLGLGFDKDALALGVDGNPDIIAIDGGSTDSGPYYLGAGVSKYSRAATLAEWKQLMAARASADVPLVLTTAGTCGVNRCVDWMLDLTCAAAAELGQNLRVATLYSTQNPNDIAEAFDGQRVFGLADAADITRGDILNCVNIVALAGVEQICAAIETGAEIIIAGRATDTSGIASLPIMNGEHVGAAWHGAKIAECGALCSTRPMSGVISVDFDDTGFEVEPLADGARCTPHSVSAHMLYENADPFVLTEPGGRLDVSNARYESVSDRRVRVTGSEWKGSDRYTVKLEGAAFAGHQTTILALLRNRHYADHSREWVDRLRDFVRGSIAERTQFRPSDYSLEFRLIGVDSVLGELERRQGQPVEVGVLCIVTASSQDAANEIARLINPFMLHFPLTKDEELPTFAFPYSPAETARGPTFEFCLSHVLELDSPMDAFDLEVHETSHASPR